MTPLPNASVKRRTGLSLGTVIAVASICSTIVSGTVAWTIVHFTVAEDKPLAVVAPEKRAPQPEETKLTPNLPPPVENEKVEEMVESSQSPIAPVSILTTMVASTAATAQDTILALQAEYDTNPYFQNRDYLKGKLNAVQTNAQQLQDLVANGGSPEDVSAQTQKLSTALNQAIDRLNFLVSDQSDTKNINQAEMTGAIKAKLEEIRASFPQP